MPNCRCWYERQLLLWHIMQQGLIVRTGNKFLTKKFVHQDAGNDANNDPSKVWNPIPLGVLAS